MTSLFVRVSRAYAKLQKVIDRIADKSESVIAYEHEEDDDVARTHVHMSIVKFDGTKETLKNWIKSIEGHGGKIAKTDWSFKELVRLEGTITYMSKGQLDPVFVKNVSNEIIENAKDNWDEPSRTRNGKITQYVVRETPKESKKRQNDLIEEMLEIIKTRYALPYADGWSEQMWDNVSLMEIIEGVMYVLKKEKVIFGRYKVRDYVDTIRCRVQKRAFLNIMIDFCDYKKQMM